MAQNNKIFASQTWGPPLILLISGFETLNKNPKEVPPCCFK